MVKIKSKIIHLSVKYGKSMKKIIDVYPEDPINIILDILNLYDKEEAPYSFIFEGSMYRLSSNFNFNFNEINIKNHTIINLISPSRGGCKYLI